MSKRKTVFAEISVILGWDIKQAVCPSVFLASINNIFGVDIALLNVALPIGISFYTFQTMSYSLDIYMNDEKPQNNIISFGTYVALFPQLIAGPIVRYKDIARELTDRKENIDDLNRLYFLFCP